ncbi:MAG: galactose mutarotase [Defluviitaleaceae bacterium]|nr:galactose mutarotase [Defluviitaleaceae bacterium]
MNIKKELYKSFHGKDVYIFTLSNKNGMKVSIIEYGARITKILVPDNKGNFDNVVLGLNTLEDYIKDKSYLGAICGRTSGRISNASFSLNGKVYNITKNDNENNLHGGTLGFSEVFWDGKEGQTKDTVFVTFNYFSRDGEEGYPGNFNISVKYILDDENCLTIEYDGTTDKPTTANLTNHTYFNLEGISAYNTIWEHELQFKSSYFAEVDNNLCPTGELISLKNHPFNFSKLKKIEDIFNNNSDIEGIDNGFLLDEKEIILLHRQTGRKLSIITDKPAVVVYTGNNIQQPFTYAGICLEVQALPDAINHKNFGSIVITKETGYKSNTKYIFSNIN